MDVKKKTFLENLRVKTKFPNRKKPGKKPLAKQGRMLAHRRSSSVPDLRFVPGEAFSTESVDTTSDAIFFGISPGFSDTDSIASGSIPDGPLFTEKLTESVPETRLRVSTDNRATGFNRISAPVEASTLYEEIDDAIKSGSQTNVNLTGEAVYAQVNKRAMENAPKFTFEPIPAPRSVYKNAQVLSPRPDLGERENLSGEMVCIPEETPADRVPQSSITAALARANSLGDQVSPGIEKKTTMLEQKKASFEDVTPAIRRNALVTDTLGTLQESVEQKKASFEDVTPAIRRNALVTDTLGTLQESVEQKKASFEDVTPAIRRNALVTDTLGTLQESSDGLSLDSFCATPNEDRVNMTWTTDSEELERELFPPSTMKELGMEDTLQGGQLEDPLEEIAETTSEIFEYFDETIQDPSENLVKDPQGPVPLQRYLLSINLKQGKNLVIRDKRSGTSDPYVKFKLEGKQFYKSKVVYKNLNPRWNESFSYPLRDREHIVEVRVYDKNRTSDDFMGSSTISLKNLDLDKTHEMELHLDDPKSKEDDMGVILVDVRLMYRDATIKRGPNIVFSLCVTTAETGNGKCLSKTLLCDSVSNRRGVYGRSRRGTLLFEACCQCGMPKIGKADNSQYAKCPASPHSVWEPVMSGTVTARDIWLLADVPLFLSLQEPQWCGLPVRRDVLMCSNRDVLYSATPTGRPAEVQKNQLKNQMWTGVLSITLVEGLDLPQYGHGDIYVRFRLGDQKYRSKNLCIQPNPQWREQFDFNQFEDIQEPLQVEVYSKRGRKSEESWGMFEIDQSRLQLNERQLCTHALDPGKGRLVCLVTLRLSWGVSISDCGTATLEKPDERDNIVEKFSLKNSHKCVGEVGFLQVKVIKANDLPATDLNGKSNPLCVIELGNSKLQTHAVYKNLNPEWNKALTFPIKDINDVMELTVLDDNGDNILGKVAIPLLTVQNGQQICLFLKKEDLESVSKGTITLELEVVYNKVRAGIRTFRPKEGKLMEENPKFSKKLLARNIYRVRKISTAVLYTLQYIKSCFQWESTQRSLIAFLIFLVTVWHGELFMLPLFLLLLIVWNYFHLTKGKASSNQDLVNMSIGDDEEEGEKECGKKGLMDKIHMVQEVVLAVQNALEELSNIGERIKNIFNWSVPFLSCLACLVLFLATALLYFIPMRYIVLIWGVNKFTKKLRNPYTIDNNEILDFLKRVPSDVQKVQYSALRAPTSQSQPRKKR
ncbi:multiple C2 and transmembrane domain-containing protein 2 [Scomber japonicus]|uniref:multiple C2 and transmembrane domain-containing protein 2 n=1 Tax=Scomber japonicus TaxID=13676 RepID=UPI002304D1F2|nr:multiple C2 and transmembrane domain-containing protein 2 [Scomber japonicus]